MTANVFSFPLYDSLNTPDVTDTELTSSEKEDCVRMLNTLDMEGRERVYMLMKKHQELSEPGGITKTAARIPYNGKRKRNKKDIDFDMGDIPSKLCRLIYKFVQLHTKAMEEEKSRSELSKAETDNVVKKE